MLSPPSQNTKTVHALAGADAIVRAPWPDGARAIKDHAGGTVWRVELAGRGVVAKVRALSGVRRRAQRVLGATPLRRAWASAEWLRANGFAAAEPLALTEGGSDGLPVECLYTEAVEGPTLLRTLVDGVAAGLLAESFGRMMGRMYVLGRWNRDAKPSNFIVGEDGALVVVDADLRRIPPGHEALERSLAAVLIETVGVGGPDATGFVRTTAVAAAREMLTDRARVSGEAFAERIVRGAARRFDEHADPRPEQDPLAHEREDGADAAVPQRDAVNA